jgi:hypothetical protein
MQGTHFWVVLVLSMTLVFAEENTLYSNLKTPSPLPYRQTLAPIPMLGDSNLSIGVRQDYDPVFVNVNEELPTRYRAVVEDSLYLQLIMLSSIGVLAMLPEDITNWNAAKLEEKSLSQRWKDHVTTKPVWDNDSWIINYIGHPVSGAWYYTMGRNDGLSIGESAALSAVMSTFFWEYGYEAFAEVPSIQDLIVTPLFGSILGEGMYILEGKLDQQGGVVFGSKSLGNVSYFFLDPLGRIVDGIKNSLLFFRINLSVTISIQTYPKFRPFPHHHTGESTDSLLYRDREIGFIITFR